MADSHDLLGCFAEKVAKQSCGGGLDDLEYFCILETLALFVRFLGEFCLFVEGCAVLNKFLHKFLGGELFLQLGKLIGIQKRRRIVIKKGFVITQILLFIVN